MQKKVRSDFRFFRGFFQFLFTLIYYGYNCAPSVNTSGEASQIPTRLSTTQLPSAPISFRINCKCSGSLSRCFTPQVELTPLLNVFLRKSTIRCYYRKHSKHDSYLHTFSFVMRVQFCGNCKVNVTLCFGILYLT